MTLKLKEIDTHIEAIKSCEFHKVKEYYRKNGVNKTDRFNRTLLLNAALYGEPELVEWAIRQHANLNHQDKKGLSVLHIAVESNQLDLVSLLLKSGIEVDLQDHFGNTALWRAMMDNVDINIIYLLLQYRANPDLKNNYGISARDLLCDENKNWEILKKIFEEPVSFGN